MVSEVKNNDNVTNVFLCVCVWGGDSGKQTNQSGDFGKSESILTLFSTNLARTMVLLRELEYSEPEQPHETTMLQCSIRKRLLLFVSSHFVFYKLSGPPQKKFEYGPLHD